MYWCRVGGKCWQIKLYLISTMCKCLPMWWGGEERPARPDIGVDGERSGGVKMVRSCLAHVVCAQMSHRWQQGELFLFIHGLWTWVMSTNSSAWWHELKLFWWCIHFALKSFGEWPEIEKTVTRWDAIVVLIVIHCTQLKFKYQDQFMFCISLNQPWEYLMQLCKVLCFKNECCFPCWICWKVFWLENWWFTWSFVLFQRKG